MLNAFFVIFQLKSQALQLNCCFFISYMISGILLDHHFRPNDVYRNSQTYLHSIVSLLVAFSHRKTIINAHHFYRNVIESQPINNMKSYMKQLRDTFFKKGVKYSNNQDNESEIDRKQLLLASRTSSINRSLINNIPAKVLTMIQDQSQCSQQRRVFRKLLQLYNKLPILNPDHPLLIVWNFLVLAVIMFYIFEIGFLLGFGAAFWQDELNNFYKGNIVFFIILIADIVICPIKAYYENGILIDKKVVIFKHYIRMGLWIDMIALIAVIIPYIDQGVLSNWLKILFFGKLINAYEIDKELLLQVRNRFKKSHIYAIFRVIFLTVLWSHYLAVCFFAIDYSVYASNYYGPDTPNHCWIYNSPLDYRIHNSHWSLQYLYSMYFSIGNMTTIAYGDIVPLNPVQTIFVIFSMILTILLFTYFFKEILEIILFSQADKFETTNNLNLIANLLEQNRVSQSLRVKIKSFFEVTWRQEKFRNHEYKMQMIAKLPKTIKEQLNLCVYGSFMQDIGLINPLQKTLHYESKTAFMFDLLQSITFELYSAGDIIYNEGEDFAQHEYVYYCDKNVQLAVTLGQGKIAQAAITIDPYDQLNEQQLNQIYAGSIKVAFVNGLFGEVQFFTCGKRSHWAVSNKNIELMKLNKSKFNDIFQREANQTERQRIFSIQQSVERLYCYICNRTGHNFLKCQFASYVPDPLRLSKKLTVMNKRVHNLKIAHLRAKQQKRVHTSNSLKLYTKMKEESKARQINSQDWFKKQDSQGQDENANIDEYIKDILSFTIFLNEHSFTNQLEQTFISQSNEVFEIDAFYQFKSYKVWNNIDRVLEHYADSTGKYKRKHRLIEEEF